MAATVASLREAIKANTLLGSEIRFRKRVKLADQAWFARQLAVFTKSGLLLQDALGLLARQRAGKAIGKVAGQMRDEILRGMSPSAVARAHEEELGPLFPAMIGAGEVSGVLGTTLGELAHLLEERLRLRRKARAAVTYPVIVIVMAVVLALAVLLVVVPTFSKMFKQFGASLPGPTQVLVTLSNFSLSHWYAIPLSFMALAGAVVWSAKQEKVRTLASRVSVRLPVVGEIFSKTALARVSSTIATMMAVGTNILVVLDYASVATQNRVWSSVLKLTRERLQSGLGMSSSVRAAAAELQAKDPQLETLAEMVEVGEKSGSVHEVLGHLAKETTEEVESRLATLESSLEPFLIVVVGSIVGTMIVSLYLPIFHIITVLGKQTATSGG